MNYMKKLNILITCILLTGCSLLNDPIKEITNEEKLQDEINSQNKEEDRRRQKYIKTKSVKAIIGRTKYDSETNVEYSGEYKYTIYATKNKITKLVLTIKVPYVEVQGAISSGEDDKDSKPDSISEQKKNYKSNLDSNGYFGYKAAAVVETHEYHLDKNVPYTLITLTVDPDRIPINDLKGYGIFHLEAFDSWNKATYKRVFKKYSNLKDYMVRSEVFS